MQLFVGFALIAAIVALRFLLPVWREWREGREAERTKDWPKAAATVTHATVEEVVREDTEGRETEIHLKVWFTYQARESQFDGEYDEICSSREEAEHLARSLKNGPFYVRYDPWDNGSYSVHIYRDVTPQPVNATDVEPKWGDL